MDLLRNFYPPLNPMDSSNPTVKTKSTKKNSKTKSKSNLIWNSKTKPKSNLVRNWSRISKSTCYKIRKRIFKFRRKKSNFSNETKWAICKVWKGF